jgi:lipoprotein-anchoring transpeptidase ErfK/SrfK
MRLVLWMAVAALAAGLVGSHAAAHDGGKPPVFADPSVEQPWIDQLSTGARKAQVQLAYHETRAERRGNYYYYYQPQRRGLLQQLFGVRPPAAQPRRANPQAARAPRAAPQQPRRAPQVAAAPRPAPAARTPKQRTIPPQFLPTTIDYATEHEPGTVVIDPAEKFLYLVQEDGKARRYGIGVGREGFGWSGTVEVGRKAQWPTWTPPKEMIKRQPWLAKYSKGMPGGPQNPLGARALYLFEGERDTLYRIHGSNEPWTIGQAVSSGCFRMRNEDVTELYERVPIGAKVVVL